MLETAEFAEGLLVHDFSAVYDFLSGQHHAACPGNRAEQVVSFCFRPFFVVDQVRADVFIQVAALQHLSLRSKFLIEEQLFVGGNRGVDAVDL